ncbi:unnamed protein product [Symbiodinium sp. CCMP2592]|nr:unnamed protein product [Symbiodinium sp. CCMP2592]
MACLGRDELLELRGQHASPSAEPLQSPKCLLVPGSLVAAPTDVATFEEEAFVSFLQVAGRPLSLRTLISLAETFQLGMSDQRHDTVAKVKRRKGKKRQPAVPEGDEEQEEGDEEDEGAEENGGEVNSKSSRRASFGANCSTEDLVRTWIQRRPDLFRPRLTPLELDTEVELACSVPLVTFQLPPFRILSEAPTDNDPEKHLQRLSRSLYEAEPNYLAVLPKNAEELSESKAENFLQLAALQDSLLTSVYGHLKKKMHRVQGPAIVPKRSGEDDTQHLLRAFRKHVEKEGYLSSAAVRAELDSICSLRECSQTQLLKDQRLGPIFLAQMKMQMFIDTTIWVAITSWPIVTYHDLESTIMKGADFQQQHRFADCGLGSLIYHPMVAHFFFGHEGDKDPQSMPPREFPKITSEQLLYLMVKGFFNNEGEFFHKKFEKEWSLEAGLAAAAASLGLPSYKGIGVYVQREFVVKQVLKQALHRREAIMRRCKGVIQESVKAGQLGSLPSWDHSRWGPFFKSLKSLRSLPEQVAYIKHVLQKEVRGIRGTGDLEAAVESIFTPLLLLAISAAHVSSKDKSGDQLEAVVNTASQLKELLPPGSNLDEPAQALRAFPSRETSLAKALLASERAVARICGLSHPSQLPLTLPELLELRPELAEALPKPEDFGRGGGASAGLCGESELTVVQHLIEQLNVSLLSLVESDVGLADLLTALGRSEAAICQQCGVACFADLQLEASFGELMARHSGELSKRMERFVQKAIQDHFGPAVTAKEVRVAFDQAAPVSPLEDVVTAVESAHALAAQTSGLWRQKRAATRVMGKEVLMNLRDVLPDWAGNFQPVLGDFSSFLFPGCRHSSSFRDAWGQHACGSLIVELRWEEFVRLPSCSVNDFFACVEARDALGAAGAALRRLADQFASAAEDGFRQMTATGMRETFVLEALAALPTEWLAKFTGITEWFLDWEARYPVHTPGDFAEASGEETVVRDRAPAEAPHVRQKREQAEVSDADSSDGGIISEGTDNDEESSDAVRNEEWANRSFTGTVCRVSVHLRVLVS